jgi:hypothetical protein
MISAHAATHRLHYVFESIESNVACSAPDLSVHSHRQTLQSRRDHERPLPAKQRQLYREERYDRPNDSREVDVYVLAVGVGDGAIATSYVVTEKDNGQESTR